MFVVVTLYREWTVGLQQASYFCSNILFASLEFLSQAQHVLFMVSGVFYYFNSILNPILYTIMSKRFRRGFNDMTGSCSAFWVRKYVLYDEENEEISAIMGNPLTLIIFLKNSRVANLYHVTSSCDVKIVAT